MNSISLTLAALVLLFVVGTSNALHKCNAKASGPVSDAHVRERDAFIQAKLAGKRGTSIEVPVYFHIFRDSKGVGDLSDTELSEQLCVLNEAFSGTSISFYQLNVNRITNDAYAYDCGENNENIYDETYDPLTVMNVYFCATIGSGSTTLGSALIPSGQITMANDEDVVRIRSDTVPGGSLTYYNEGDTLVHEVGHYLGLFHVFEGNSCFGRGDHIDDTPQQASANQAIDPLCPTDRDTCPSMPGLDNVQNYMDYSVDCCLDEFTPDQISTMEYTATNYRDQLGNGHTNTGETGSGCQEYTCDAGNQLESFVHSWAHF